MSEEDTVKQHPSDGSKTSSDYVLSSDSFDSDYGAGEPIIFSDEEPSPDLFKATGRRGGGWIGRVPGGPESEDEEEDDPGGCWIGKVFRVKTRPKTEEEIRAEKEAAAAAAARAAAEAEEEARIEVEVRSNTYLSNVCTIKSNEKKILLVKHS